MDTFDFSAPADMYASRDRGRGPIRRPSTRSTMTYRRFATGGEAVQYVIEGMNEQMRAGATLESGDGRFTADDIRTLYDREDYPLERAATPPANSVKPDSAKA